MLLASLGLVSLVTSHARVGAQAFLAGAARNASGVLVVVRPDATESRFQGRGALQIFDGDTLRIEGGGQALIETEEGSQIILNGNAVLKILSRWEKGKGVTRVVRLQRGQVWARSHDAQRPVEVETPVGVLAARAAEVSVTLLSDNEAAAVVVNGTADLATPLGTCQLRSGTVSYGSRGRPCTPPAAADILSAVSWSRPLLVP
jgi:hypothetical protein